MGEPAAAAPSSTAAIEVDPNASPASTISFGTWRMPRFVSRIPTGSA